MERFSDWSFRCRSSQPTYRSWPIFSALADPRQQWRVMYPLREVLLLVLCATLCGMDDFVEVGLWGKEQPGFLRRFLPYERGLP